MPVIKIKCENCGHGMAYYEQRQTRSADEGSTLFYTCVQCNNKWNESWWYTDNICQFAHKLYAIMKF